MDMQTSAIQPAELAQEPVYFVWLKAHCAWLHTDKAGFDKTADDERWMLYAAPPAQQAAPLMPKQDEAAHNDWIAHSATAKERFQTSDYQNFFLAGWLAHHQRQSPEAQPAHAQPAAIVVAAQYEDGSPAGHRLEWRGCKEANDFPEGTEFYTNPPAALVQEHKELFGYEIFGHFYRDKEKLLQAFVDKGIQWATPNGPFNGMNEEWVKANIREVYVHGVTALAKREAA